MARGVPSRVKVLGNGTRTYTFTEVAAGTGLSLSLVSLVLRGKRTLTEYSQSRLAMFFGINSAGTITVETPPVRPVGRVVARVHADSPYRPPVQDRYPISQWLERLQESESDDFSEWLRAHCPGEK